MNWVFFVGGQEPFYVDTAMAGRIAETDRVLAIGPSISFVRAPADISLKRRVPKPINCRIETYYQPLHFPIRMPVVGSALQMMNAHFFRREMRKFLPTRPDILCLRRPDQHNLIGMLQESLSVYYATDDYIVDLEGRQISGELELERQLLEKVELIICVTEELANRLRERAPRGVCPPIHIISNSYDERIFNPEKAYPEPLPLRGIHKPRILVAGHISDRIDWSGIIAAARLRPAWSWVFLGRATEPFMDKRIQQLGARGFLCPQVPYEEVPAWIQHADACAIPYCLNKFTLASDPAKATEYLAMGAAVLSTRVPSLSRFGEAIHSVKEGDGESYATALDAIYAESEKEGLKALRRKAVAADRLQARVQQFRTIVQGQISADNKNRS